MNVFKTQLWFGIGNTDEPAKRAREAFGAVNVLQGRGAVYVINQRAINSTIALRRIAEVFPDIPAANVRIAKQSHPMRGKVTS